MSDVEALRLYQTTGDAQAFANIVHRYQRLVYAACRRHLNSAADVEDATQETFLRLAKRAGDVQTSLAGWLHTCAVRVSLDLIRQNASRQRSESSAAVPVAEASPIPDPEWQELSRELDAALEQLPDEDRSLILRVFYQGDAQTAIAQDMGISQPTISRRINAAVANLRINLRQRGVTTPAATIITLLTADAASANVPATLTAAATKIGLAGAGAASTMINTTFNAGIRTMATTKIVAAGITTLAIISACIWGGSRFFAPTDARAAAAETFTVSVEISAEDAPPVQQNLLVLEGQPASLAMEHENSVYTADVLVERVNDRLLADTTITHTLDGVVVARPRVKQLVGQEAAVQQNGIAVRINVEQTGN